MKIIDEFKEFAIKGNMVDMAVGIIIGTAFNNVVQTLVKKVALPPLAYLTDGLNFEDKKYVLKAAATNGAGKETSEIAIYYGELFEVCIDFLVIGITVFFVIKMLNKLRNKSHNPEEKQVSTPKNIELLNDLKLLMKEQNELLKSKK
ncbi:large-conductance mechanosensitivone channel [Nonlabens tegetincola]|uniref:Large-conductance mechanosensitive channel n=1 Tax=Nonlabens tegetincola TaxID=323273 RepID=A0A090Q756_9FLAO|nr:large conductance mechanosensitive channel protein MscL [Nonlabens tegetincola]GAK97588.1 large-conductance mechanosensitivone channel [Nonlabens tegetincola]